MEIRYLVADADDQLQLVANEQIEALWADELPTWELHLDLGGELRLITVVRDEDMNPKICFFARIELHGGRLEPESRRRACRLLGRRMHVSQSPEMRRHFAGWPSDWVTQLAVALDAPPESIARVGLGGPLLMSTVWGVSMNKVLEYFEMIDD